MVVDMPHSRNHRNPATYSPLIYLLICRIRNRNRYKSLFASRIKLSPFGYRGPGALASQGCTCTDQSHGGAGIDARVWARRRLKIEQRNRLLLLCVLITDVWLKINDRHWAWRTANRQSCPLRESELLVGWFRLTRWQLAGAGQRRGKTGLEAQWAQVRDADSKIGRDRYRSLVYAVCMQASRLLYRPPLLLNIPIRVVLTRAHLHIGTPSAFLFPSPLLLKLASRHFCTPPVPLLLQVLDCCARALLFS